MRSPTKKLKPNTRGPVIRDLATLRSTSGAGFEFEDLISAWQMVKALAGEPAPGIGGVVTAVQAQVSTLGWSIDDLLLTADASDRPRRLAISAKGNVQVTAAGLPKDFVIRAWGQWRNTEGPFDRTTDGLALATLGTQPAFMSAWAEVKNACSGGDPALAIGRIRGNSKQSRVFNSVQVPGAASDQEAIELIRRLHVLPTDLQLRESETVAQAIAQCRRLLASGAHEEAQSLWKALIDVAEEVRLRSGTISVSGLVSRLRRQFGLRHHPDFKRDWKTLSDIMSDHRARIETELPAGNAIPRRTERKALLEAVAGNPLTVVFGDSGTGKSALVKMALDEGLPPWNQVWFGPEALKTALSAARRGTLPLSHELSAVLNATVKPQNVLVIDAAERIDAGEFAVVRQLLRAIVPPDADVNDSAWRVIVITQTQGWLEGGDSIFGGRKAQLFEVEPLTSEVVKAALRQSPALAWLTGHDDTIAVLTNLKILAWVVKAGPALASNAGGLASHTAVADRLWKYWTADRADMQALLMRLAEREASFERSFALTGLVPADVATFTQRPEALPLRLDRRTNCIAFEHDLAADWARFQFLKQIWTDMPQWGNLAGNPLWMNALRMLGQFLLQQPAEVGTAWDVAYRTADNAKNLSATAVLLDALCLDPDAERLLSERVDLLFGDGAKRFSQLMLRFHHVATVPVGSGTGLGVVGLYIETQYRSLIVGRWPPVLRFLIAQRERLAGVVSSALANVIETWLTKTPRGLADHQPTPFRREMAEIALAMARSVQVEKGHGVLYVTREPALYTAPLAGAADLPTEIGHWALELAGRRPVAFDVEERIAHVRQQKAKVHAERLKADAAYKARHEERRQVPRSLSSYREHLPPWSLGASGKVDREFRDACFKQNGLQSLMLASPEAASEVLLALIIEDQPERDTGSGRYEVDLGLAYPEDAYPTAFWKSPYFAFFKLAPEVALTSLIALVNFCTERWVAEMTGDRAVPPPGVTLRIAHGAEKTFAGWWQVFGWPQSNDSIHNGNLFCALDALERWLTLRLDEGDDITATIVRILSVGDSAALISVLVNVAKYQPSLLKSSLAALLTFPNLFYWDGIRVRNVGHNFVEWSWRQGGEAMFEFARSWGLAPHRQRTFHDVVVELLLDDAEVAQHLQALLPTWTLPDDPKEALEFRLLFAGLDRANYRSGIDPDTRTETWRLVYPDDLQLAVTSWQAEREPTRDYLLVPEHCEQRLRGGQPLTGDEAAYLFRLLQTCETDAEGDDEEARSRCRFAAAGTLVVLGGAWLSENGDAERLAVDILRAAVAGVASTAEAMRGRRAASLRDELRFVAYAVMHLWLTEGDGGEEWEAAVLRLLTSGDTRATAVVVGIAYAHRERLGSAWWRLLRAGLFWSGLSMLTPHHGDGDEAERAWNMWLARLRRFPLRGWQATLEQLDFQRIVAAQERLDFARRMRIYEAGDQTWRGKPERDRGGSLDWHFLEALFSWIIDGNGTGNRSLDISLVLRIWDYDATRAKARARKYGEYDLPSQNLGYDVLLKLAALTVAAPAAEQRAIWEPVLAHGAAAHTALQHFIRGLFVQLGKAAEPAAFEKTWRAVAEYGLVAEWSQPGLWFYGERLLGDLLGFGNEDALSRLGAGAVMRMKDLYERWAAAHLMRDEECVTRFCHFLTTDFGAPLRLNGLRWVAAVLNGDEPAYRWYRDGTGEALVELAAAALSSDSTALSQDASARQALVVITAALAAKNVPTALALQERVKLLR